jgi:hypothetical protein
MRWVIKSLGAKGIVFPGFGRQDHARAAIQSLSQSVVRKTVYAHTGWRTIAGKEAFLHAGGAIGADGDLAGVEVSLPPSLSGYRLPSPLRGEKLRDAIRCNLKLLSLGSSQRMYPIFGAIWRSVLGPCDFAIHFTGTSGVFKSEIAALCNQHFGGDMSRRNLPASWSGSGSIHPNSVMRLSYEQFIQVWRRWFCRDVGCAKFAVVVMLTPIDLILIYTSEEMAVRQYR